MFHIHGSTVLSSVLSVEIWWRLQDVASGFVGPAMSTKAFDGQFVR